MSYRSERHFKLWDYNVSHSQLLIRSPKSPTESENIDLAFYDVVHVDVPTMLDGVELAEASHEMVSAKLGQTRSLAKRKVFVLTSAGRQFIVVASGFRVLRNDLDIFESSLEYFDATSPADRDLGTVLARS